jgi:hypothetical protein
MKWSEEVKGMQEDAEKIVEALKAAYRERDYILVGIYITTFPFMLLGFIAGEFIGRVIVFLVWKFLALCEDED